MFSISAFLEARPTTKDFRAFGLSLGALFSFIGLIPFVLHSSTPSPVLLLGIACTIAAMLVPRAFRLLYALWLLFGGVVGHITVRVLLGLVFYLVVTPLRVLVSLAGKDPMKRTFDMNADTYRVLRMPREPSHMRRPF